MDHSQAIETEAAERYLLGELPAAEAEDFERHYFECQECAQAVEVGNQFIANAQAVLTETDSASGRDRRPARPRQPFWHGLMEWWPRPAFVPLAAAVAFAAIALYQGAIVIPGMRQALDSARVLPAFQLAGVSRGEASRISVPRSTPFVTFSVDVPPDVHSPQYLCVLTAGGRPVFRVTAPPPANGQPITILVPVKELRASDYDLTIYGADGRESDKITTYSFQFGLQ